MGGTTNSGVEQQGRFFDYVKKVDGTYVPEERKIMISEHLVVDARPGDLMWGELKVQVIPLRPKKNLFGQETSHGKEALRALQDKWGATEDAIPMIMSVESGTQGHTSHMVVAKPSYFLQANSVLEMWLESARRNENTWKEEALDFVLTAKTGERPKGSKRPQPWKG